MPHRVLIPMEQDRRNPSHTFKLTAEHPGVIRVQKITQDAIREHDEKWKEADPKVWQSQYALLNHCEKVRAVTVAICEAMGMDETAILIASIAGLNHDVGKLEEICRLYRIVGTLTPKQKAEVDLHSQYSGDRILEYMEKVREEDLPLLWSVYHVVRFHHTPQRIEDQTLRQIGFNLNCADRFVSLQEDRGERLGLGLSEALKRTRRSMQNMIRELPSDPYRREILATVRSLKHLYNLRDNISSR